IDNQLSSCARRGPTIRGPSPPSLRSGDPPNRGLSGRHTKASFALFTLSSTLTLTRHGRTTRLIPGVRARLGSGAQETPTTGLIP
ncbi:hypothetical protein C8R44DRAFT_761572, partial [Mycena epipterygia]